MVTYKQLKTAAIDVIDDYSDFNVMANYGGKYTAKTKLTTLGIGSALMAFMAKPLNKRMRDLMGEQWRGVGPADLQSINTIGKMIVLCCGQAGVAIEKGEPK